MLKGCKIVVMESTNHLKFYAILNYSDYVGKSYVMAFVINDFYTWMFSIMPIEPSAFSKVWPHFTTLPTVHVGAAVIDVIIVALSSW